MRYGIGEDGKLHEVWLPNTWFEDRCATHDGRGIGQDGENYAEANGWLPWCARCRWNPARDTEPASTETDSPAIVNQPV